MKTDLQHDFSLTIVAVVHPACTRLGDWTSRRMLSKRTVRWTKWLLSVVVLSTTCFGCSKPTSDTTGPNTVEGPQEIKETKRIAIVLSTLNNPWFVVLGETARDRAIELGYDATLFDSQNDTAKEADHFDNIIAGGYAAILFNPTDTGGSVTNVRRAKEAGIPVFCIDREIGSSDDAVTQLLSDNYSGCVALGKYFVEQVGEEGKYAELLGLTSDSNTWNRSKGFHSVVDRYPELKMVAQQSADFDRSKALEVMESILQSHSDISAVFCGNDAMAMGAYQALLGAGKAKQVKVFGFDGAEDVVKSIADGKIVATVMQYPKLMARTAAEYADQYIKGQREFEQKIPVNVELVHVGNIDQFTAYGKESKQ